MPGILLLLLLLLLCALGIVLLWRIPLCPAADDDAERPSLAIIIPARDEERSLPILLESLRAQSMRPSELIVVDDESTDRTAEIASSHGATVLKSGSLPDGWRGKTWACQQGAEHASSEILLFVDADTFFLPDALHRVTLAYQNAAVRVLSLGAFHEVGRPYENLSAVFNLMTFMGMESFALWGSPHQPHGLFGSFLMIDRATHTGVGGHASVRGEILEHMTLSRLLRDRDIPMLCLGGRGVFHIRMYPEGLHSLVEGWTKAFAAGASKTRPGIVLAAVGWMTGGLLAFIFFLVATCTCTHLVWYGLGYGVFAIATYLMLRRIGTFSWLAALFYPVLLIFFIVVFARSAFLRQTARRVRWKGRSIEVERPEDTQ